MLEVLPVLTDHFLPPVPCILHNLQSAPSLPCNSTVCTAALTRHRDGHRHWSGLFRFVFSKKKKKKALWIGCGMRLPDDSVLHQLDRDYLAGYCSWSVEKWWHLPLQWWWEWPLGCRWERHMGKTMNRIWWDVARERIGSRFSTRLLNWTAGQKAVVYTKIKHRGREVGCIGLEHRQAVFHHDNSNSQ